MYKNGDTCPICGGGPLKKMVITERFEYKESNFAIPDYVVYECSECEESIVDPQTLKTTEKEIRDFHREVDGLLTSSEIRKIRNSFKLTQEEFGEILGGGKKAFARYENGTVTQSKPMDNLLRVLSSLPIALEIIQSRKKMLDFENFLEQRKGRVNKRP